MFIYGGSRFSHVGMLTQIGDNYVGGKIPCGGPCAPGLALFWELCDQTLSAEFQVWSLVFGMGTIAYHSTIFPHTPVTKHI